MAPPIKAAPPNVWAYADHGCTKLYVVKSREQLRAMPAPESPFGCRKPNDASEILRGIVEGHITPTPMRYVNVPQ